MTSSALNILLAEDNRDDATLFRMALDKAKVAVNLQIVSDGEQAVAYLKGEGKYADRAAYPIPSFLVLDLNMPRKNGFEVLEWVRSDDIHNDLIVHVLSASSRDEDRCRVNDLQANSYLVKPSRLSDLVVMVQSLVTAHTPVSPPARVDSAPANKEQGKPPAINSVGETVKSIGIRPTV